MTEEQFGRGAGRSYISVATAIVDVGAEARRVGVACGVGAAIEQYDFFIYGTAGANQREADLR